MTAPVGVVLKEGDLCFAHVKSSPWWPALISCKKVKKSKKVGQSVFFSVVFFGKDERANLPEKDVVSVSSESINKCVTKESLRRKFFKEAYNELLRKQDALQEQLMVTSRKEDEEKENCFTDNPTQQEFLSQLCLKESIPQSQKSPHSDKVNVQTSKLTRFSSPTFNLDSAEFEDLLDESPKKSDTVNVEEINFQCDECSKSFKCEASLERHCNLKHREVNDEDDGGIFIDQVPINKKGTQEVSAESASKSAGQEEVTTKKSASRKRPKQKKKNGQTKLVRTLQEDELEANKLFAENIEVKQNFFFCKLCKKFSTSTEMRAKLHAGSCGRLKKRKRIAAVSKCLQCDQEFPSKKELLLHHKQHRSLQYTCSSCLKTFNRHNSYLRHLRSHKEPPKLKCTSGDCVKVFRYSSDLKRHMRTHNKAPTSTFRSAVEPKDIEFQIDLEERRIIGDYCGKLSVKQLGNPQTKYEKNYTSFESSLNVKNVEDWNAFVDISNRFGLPLSSFHPSGSAESCTFTNTKGEKIVQFAWNSFQTPEDLAREIVLQLVDETVNAACLRDSEVTNDEFSEIINDTIKEIMEKHAYTGVVTEALAPLDVGVVSVLDSLEDSSTDGGEKLSEHGSGLHSDCAGMEENEGDGEGRLLEDIDSSSVDDKAGSTEESAGSDEQEDQIHIAGLPSVGLTCPHCGTVGITRHAKLLLHIERMHSKPFTCVICRVEFVDRYHFNLHSPTCYHLCPIAGCNFKEKRQERMKGHLRRHTMK